MVLGHWKQNPHKFLAMPDINWSAMNISQWCEVMISKVTEDNGSIVQVFHGMLPSDHQNWLCFEIIHVVHPWPSIGLIHKCYGCKLFMEACQHLLGLLSGQQGYIDPDAWYMSYTLYSLITAQTLLISLNTYREGKVIYIYIQIYIWYMAYTLHSLITAQTLFISLNTYWEGKVIYIQIYGIWPIPYTPNNCPDLINLNIYLLAAKIIHI